MIIGLQASGKTSIVKNYEKEGYYVLSRDTEGGSMNGLLLKFKKMLTDGVQKILLDNTNLTVEVRKPFIDTAKEFGYKVSAAFMNTSFEDAQFNAVTRMVRRTGKLFKDKEDYKTTKDPNIFPPAALFSSRKELQKPKKDEGFDKITIVDFIRIPSGNTNKAILLDYDGTLRDTKSGAKYPTEPDDIIILPNRKETLKKYVDQGYMLLGVSNQSGVAKGLLTYEQAEACFKRTNELLGFDIEVSFCPHSVPPITCYCRKPGVGHGVEFIEKYKLDPAQCIMVGDLGTDKSFAARCGFTFIEAEEFFK